MLTPSNFLFPRLTEVPILKTNGPSIMKRMIWIEGDDFTGWCCSVCEWGMTAPRLDSTVAALAFNRVAQETFEKHNCAAGTPI